MANVVNGVPGEGGIHGAQAAEELGQRQPDVAAQAPSVPSKKTSAAAEKTFAEYGPGLPVLFLLPRISTRAAAGVILGEDDLPGTDADADARPRSVHQ